jgi:hypothetical protein
MQPSLAAGWSHVLLLRLLGDLCVEDSSAWVVVRSDALTGASIAALLWCSVSPSLVAFALAAVLHVAKKVLVMPEGLDNNGTYLLLVMANVLHGALCQLLRRGGADDAGTTGALPPVDDSDMEQAAAAARGLTLALYCFAAFAKVNANENCPGLAQIARQGPTL